MKYVIARRDHQCRVILVVGAALMVMAVMAACGKKGPPLPPDLRPKRAPIDLRVEADGDHVTLCWQPSHSSAVVAGYDIFRASHPLSEPSCPSCHQQFQKIESLTAISGAGEQHAGEMVFSQQVPPGFHYTYKVRPYDRNGKPGADSNFFGVDVP